MRTQTQQQIFNTVAAHLLSQGEKAQDGDECLYKTPEGLQCALGCLIADADYRDTLEGLGPPDLDDILPQISDTDLPMPFYEELQEIHDRMPVSRWRERLAEFAVIWGLDDSVLVTSDSAEWELAP